MRRSIPTVLLTAVLTLLLGIAPAGAAPKDEQGNGGGQQGVAVTEDTDTNDGVGNNVVDNGDNMHPSGKDRSVEHGGSGNQGKAKSDPDNNNRGPERRNGGADKPGGAGGDDLADQDGNNGCGNDDDFEDDNEGHCRRGKKVDANTKGGKADTGGKPAGDKDQGKGAKTETGGTPAGDKDQGKGAKADTGAKPKDAKSGTGGRAAGGKGENKQGNGTANITVNAECNSVSVNSSKDISHVVVNFADGTSTKFDGLRGHTWSKTFSQTVASARAKSATTVVSAMAGGCASAAATVVECERGTMTAACDDDTTTGIRTETEVKGNGSEATPGFRDDIARGIDVSCGNESTPAVCAVAAAAADDDRHASDDEGGEVLGAAATVDDAPKGGGLVHALSGGNALVATLASTVAASAAGSVVGALAVTGFDVADLVALGFGLIILGLIARRNGRRSVIAG